MPTSVIMSRKVWDIVVSRSHESPLAPVWLCRHGENRILLCQVAKTDSGWSVVVAGKVRGLRFVEGFRSRQQAIRYAIDVRSDLN